METGTAEVATEMTTEVSFHLKDRFSSFTDLQSKIDKYCQNKYIKLWGLDQAFFFKKL